MEPSHWKTFVSNKVAAIQYKVPLAAWNYVHTKDNPADLISRGYDMELLPSHSLWWNGPSWLLEWKENKKCSTNEFETSFESKPQKITLLTNNTFIIDKLLHHYSDVNKLIRALAWWLRFMKILKKELSNPPKYLSIPELKDAQFTLIKILQNQSFSDEIQCVTKQVALTSKSRLRNLSLFLDKTGCLRVGGRLEPISLILESTL